MNKCQFYTTNYKYILKGLPQIPIDEIVLEPFVGYGHLLNLIQNKKVECYDIDDCGFNNVINMGFNPKKRDTLKDIPIYKNKYILTNPPFLARNKSNNKLYYNLHSQDDL